MNTYLIAKKIHGNSWSIITNNGISLKSNIYFKDYFEAYEYLKSYSSSWSNMNFKVLKEDGSEWEYLKINS